jgi:hypothetical protein
VPAGFGGLAGAGLLVIVPAGFLAIRGRRRVRSALTAPIGITPLDAPGDKFEADGAQPERAATGESETAEVPVVPESGDADRYR